VKQAVGAGAMELLRAHFAPASKGLDLQITVEVGDIRKATYFKDPPGTLGPPSLSLI